jgi:hypothetical protein
MAGQINDGGNSRKIGGFLLCNHARRVSHICNARTFATENRGMESMNQIVEAPKVTKTPENLGSN